MGNGRRKEYHPRPRKISSQGLKGFNWKKSGTWVLYFLIGSECIYHIFKGLCLTALFVVYTPWQKISSMPMDDRGVVGATLFSLDEWSYHFLYGLRGPMVLFSAYLLYKYACHISPFKETKPKAQRTQKPRSRASTGTRN